MSDPDVKVRVATTADVDQIMQLAICAAKENGFLDANTTLLLKAVWGPLNQDHGIIGCIGDSPIEAMVVLNVGTIFYSETPCLEERTLFVRPEYRSAKGGRARKLVEFSKLMATALSLPLLIGVLSNERTAAKCKLYSRLLGPAAGAYWIFQAQTGGHEVAA